jgi:hypothetical protein
MACGSGSNMPGNAALDKVAWSQRAPPKRRTAHHGLSSGAKGRIGSRLRENSEGVKSGSNMEASNGAETRILRKISFCTARRKQTARFHTASVIMSPPRTARMLSELAARVPSSELTDETYWIEIAHLLFSSDVTGTSSTGQTRWVGRHDRSVAATSIFRL